MYLAICDDDILLCANLRRKLAAFDTGGNKLLVDEYHSGEELLKGACRCNYDAVFLDLYMDGKGISRKKKRSPDYFSDIE